MEDCNRREGNNEIIKEDDTIGEEEKDFENQYQLMRKSPFNNKRNKNEKSSRSRSRSRNRQLQGQQRKSANAFINFMQDFKQNYGKMKSKDLFRLGGQRWREMSTEEKMPYIKAAKLAKQQHSNKSEDTNKTNGSDSMKKFDKRNQKKKKREDKRRSRSKTDDSDMESDTATSETAASMTSEDASDLSS